MEHISRDMMVIINIGLMKLEHADVEDRDSFIYLFF